jgi:hypothetical protein
MPRLPLFFFVQPADATTPLPPRSYNGTLMAYGQTGAGKTFSLSSIGPDSIGMIPRAAAEIFTRIEGDASHEYTVYMSYVQLYMELIQVKARELWNCAQCTV